MSAVCIGNSHMGALIEAALSASQAGEVHPHGLAFVLLHQAAFQPAVNRDAGVPRLNPRLLEALDNALTARADDQFRLVSFPGSEAGAQGKAIISLIGGNAHNILGLMAHNEPFDFVLNDAPDLPLAEGATIISESEVYDLILSSVRNEMGDIFNALTASFDQPVFQLESPPPIRSNEHISANLDPFFGSSGPEGVSSPFLRYKLWRLHSRAVRSLCDAYGLGFIPCPQEALDEEGFLRAEFTPDNATHANSAYGALLIAQIEDILAGKMADRAPRHSNPYSRLAPTAFWREAVVKPDAAQMAPVTTFPFRVRTQDKVATAGSCFAQHIARHLSGSGFNYYVPEIAHPIMPAELAQRFNYGVFSARYGNLYTSRQLLQLFQRAQGEFDPQDRFWRSSDGTGFVDPYRPAIQPVPFTSVRALEEDRRRHLAAVDTMMRGLDVFVFTLGLTECWINKSDGAAYPLCPGTSGGSFDPDLHAFVNLRVEEVRDDLIAAFAILRRVNPGARIILTVSPVPLKATASDDHVLSATTYSKSVLRAAAGEVSKMLDNVAYFPSYEIITGSYARGKYFSANLRDVEPEGVAHVMRVFSAHMTQAAPEAVGIASAESFDTSSVPADAGEMTSGRAADLICEEEMLEMERMLSMRG